MTEFEEDGIAGASALVTVTLEITSDGHWGKEATIAEVRRQGGREAMAALERVLRDGKIKAKIIGRPDVGVITWRIK